MKGDHLDRLVVKDPVAGLAELVWNSLDADATTVRISVRHAELGGVDQVVVEDDGYGFSPDEAEELMSSLGGSWKHQKADKKTRSGKRVLHGSKGEGRFRAFAMGDRVRWESVVEDGRGRRLTTLNIRRSDLRHFEWDEQPTQQPVGTKVTVFAGSVEPTSLSQKSAPRSLLERFALYLTLYPGVTISYNGDDLDPGTLTRRTDTVPTGYSDENGVLEVVVIEWLDPVDRALYLCDADGAALHQIPPEAHAAGIHFTAYAKWEGFREHENKLLLAEGSPETSQAVEAARDALRGHFQRRARDRSNEVVGEWRNEKVYPYKKAPETDLERAEQALFNYVAVTAESAVNRIKDRKAKEMSLHTMKVAVTQDPGAVEAVFREVLALPEEKLDELHELIGRVSLGALVGAMKKVSDRILLVEGLKAMLFGEDISPHVDELDHLQGIIGGEPWLFGEEYAMHASNEGLTKVLKAHLRYLGRDPSEAEPVRDSEGKIRRVDFMFGRSLEHSQNLREHLVVEIKRPGRKLTRGELNQIEDYAQAVAADSQFDTETTHWEFLLVGSEIDGYVANRLSQADDGRGPVFEISERNARVWVREWGAVLAEAEHRMKFVQKQLSYDPTSGDAIKYLTDNYPEHVPPEIAPPQAGGIQTR
ncbi:MAG: ATP-binding protein [bacterium]|nr:ATP-binding protein [bacterium]